MSDYMIWFDVEGFEEIQLPVNPSEVTITYPGNLSNYDVEGIGEIIIPRLPKLATVTFDSFFPREGVYTTLSSLASFYSPEWYYTFFRRLQKLKETFRLTIVRQYENSASGTPSMNNFDTVFNSAVLMDFSITDKGGEPGDIYFSMSISEYRDASPRTLAEVARQDVDEKGNITLQRLVPVPNRPVQKGVITTESLVTINGKVYTSESEIADDWKKTKQQANQVDGLVTRVLPPQMSNKLHSVYINGLGWVNKSDCELQSQKGNVNVVKGLIGNE